LGTTGLVATGLRPSELACELVESEPGSKRAQEARVKNETLRFRRDALALRNRSVQLSRNWEADEFTSGRREFGAGVSTIASPLGFGGAAYIFAQKAKKQRQRQQKRPLLGNRFKNFRGLNLPKQPLTPYRCPCQLLEPNENERINTELLHLSLRIMLLAVAVLAEQFAFFQFK
jgi:hypothetical protein